MSDKINVIELGAGRHVIDFGLYGKRPAIFIEPVPTPGVVGSDATGKLPKDSVVDGGTVIVFENAASAEVLIDIIRRSLPTETR